MDKIKTLAMGVVCGLGLPALALAEGTTTFAVTAPDFDFTVMGAIAAIMLGIAASVTVYRKVKGIASRG